MDVQRWTSLLGRVTPEAAADIDDLVGDFDLRRGPAGGDLLPETPAVLPAPAFKRADGVCVGFRVTAAPPDAADRAMRLVAFAIEKDVEIIVLSHVDISGFEGFGFRVERVAGDSEAARGACERQICRFWNIDLVL